MKLHGVYAISISILCLALTVMAPGETLAGSLIESAVLAPSGLVGAAAVGDRTPFDSGESRIQSSADERSLASAAFYFNPLGVLQFGPMVGAELCVLPNVVFDGHFRWSALGIVYQAIESDGFEDEVSFTSAAIGGGVRYFIEMSNSPHRVYVGGIVEYGWGSTRGDINTEYEWKGEDAYVVFASNFGYRWRFSSGFFVNFGAFAGVAQSIKDDWWYVMTPYEIEEPPLDTVLFGMVELSFGLGI